MKNLFFVSVFSLLSISIFAQSVSIAATNGGSVTLTPEGVTRSTPALPKGIAATTRATPTAKPAAKPKPRSIGELTTYTFTITSVAEARMVFNAYRGTRDDENATAADVANFDAIRKYIVENKDFVSTKKTLTVVLPADKIDRVFQNGMYYNNKKELMRQLRQLETEEKLYNACAKQETDANVPEENSKLRWQKQKYEQ